MEHQLTLVYTDDAGNTVYVPLRPPGATIGRVPDNDIVIPEQKLSRHHAAIEFRGHIPFVIDEGSSNGTTLNGKAITSPTEFKAGDTICLGGAVTLEVVPDAVGETPPGAGHQPQESDSASSGPHAEAPSLFSVPALAGAGAGLILLLAAVAIILTMRHTPDAGRAMSEDSGGPLTSSSPSPVRRSNLPEPSENQARPVNENNGEAGAASNATPLPADLERDIKRAMSRISKDNAPYISRQGVADVASRIKAYQSSPAFAPRIRAIQSNCPALIALAQANSLKPALLAYAAIAQAGDSGDPLQEARRMAPKLLTLRATFGSDTANSSLLLIAAYPYPFNPAIGSQARTAHPLASKLVELGGRRSMEDTSVARSVWFLREKNGIIPEAYELVVNSLAVGVLAQDPQRYGINVDPLIC